MGYEYDDVKVCYGHLDTIFCEKLNFYIGILVFAE